MNESKLPPSRANMYVQLGAQLYSGTAPHASASNYIVGELHTERTMLTRDQIAARCRRERLEAGLPVYEAPRLSSREARPSQPKSLLQQAVSMATGLRTVAEAVFDAVMPRIPGAAASELGSRGTGDYPAPAPLEKSGRLPLGGAVSVFAELVESLGLHASFSHEFARLDPSEPARSASWVVKPSFDPDTLSLDDLLVLLESSQPDDLRRADQLKIMLTFLLQEGMRIFTASPETLDRLPCGAEADCVPVRSLCDGKVLLDTVLAAVPGKGNVVILPPDAIESLASMINPAYGNATEDFVWVTSSSMRTLGPQYRLNCPAPTTTTNTTGQVSAQPRPSCIENETRSMMEGFAFGLCGGIVIGVVVGATVFLCRDAAKATASVAQRVPQHIRHDNREDQNNDEAKDDMDYGMENMKNMKNMKNEDSENNDEAETSELKEISSSAEND